MFRAHKVFIWKCNFYYLFCFIKPMYCSILLGIHIWVHIWMHLHPWRKAEETCILISWQHSSWSMNAWISIHTIHLNQQILISFSLFTNMTKECDYQCFLLFIIIQGFYTSKNYDQLPHVGAIFLNIANLPSLSSNVTGSSRTSRFVWMKQFRDSQTPYFNSVQESSFKDSMSYQTSKLYELLKEKFGITTKEDKYAAEVELDDRRWELAAGSPFEKITYSIK